MSVCSEVESCSHFAFIFCCAPPRFSSLNFLINLFHSLNSALFLFLFIAMAFQSACFTETISIESFLRERDCFGAFAHELLSIYM